jgi:hypothetical protein
MLDKAVNKKPLGNFFPEMCGNSDIAFLKSVFGWKSFGVAGLTSQVATPKMLPDLKL